MRLLSLFFLLAALLVADTFKLYLKDGSFHLVREYQAQGDRVRYFSTERGDYEEIPKDLVDLDKTEREHRGKAEASVRNTRELDEEEKAERALAKEIASIPVESGAFYKPANVIRPLKLPEFQIITDKKRRIIQYMSPIPIIPGKATVVIKGEHSAFSVTERRPEFYLRLAKEEKFGIIRLTGRKGMRIVENISIIAVSHQSIEDRKQMDTFEQQLAGDLYKVWPEKPLDAGEYALMEYSDSDSDDKEDVQLLVYDFSVR